MYLKVRLSIAVILMIKVQGLSLWTRTTSCKARIIEVDISAFWAVFLARVKLITSRDSSPLIMGKIHAKTRHWKSFRIRALKPRIRRVLRLSVKYLYLTCSAKTKKCIIVSMRLCNDALSTLTLPLSKCSSLMNFRK